MSAWSLTYQQSVSKRYHIYQSFTCKMAAKINWHIYGTKLRHCHPVYIQRRVSAELSPYRHQDVLTDSSEVVVRHGMGMKTIFAETGEGGNKICGDGWRRYDTIRDAILTCARKLTRVSLIYRTEPTNKKCKTEKLKRKNGYAQK